MIICIEPFKTDTKKDLIESINYIENEVDTIVSPSYQLNNKSKRYLLNYFNKLLTYRHKLLRNVHKARARIDVRDDYTVKK